MAYFVGQLFKPVNFLRKVGFLTLTIEGLLTGVHCLPKGEKKIERKEGRLKNEVRNSKMCVRIVVVSRVTLHYYNVQHHTRDK